MGGSHTGLDLALLQPKWFRTVEGQLGHLGQKDLVNQWDTDFQQPTLLAAPG